ncbi:hypothetical protein [Pseudoalteromonas phage PH357]|nr:hypothetical protein [Pseudoalteromonas phage PH357]
MYDESLKSIRDFLNSEEGENSIKSWVEDIEREYQQSLAYYETKEFFEELDNMKSGELSDWKVAETIFKTYPEYVYEDENCDFPNKCVDYDHGDKTFKFQIIHGQGSILLVEVV